MKHNSKSFFLQSVKAFTFTGLLYGGILPISVGVQFASQFLPASYTLSSDWIVEEGKPSENFPTTITLEDMGIPLERGQDAPLKDDLSEDTIEEIEEMDNITNKESIRNDKTTPKGKPTDSKQTPSSKEPSKMELTHEEIPMPASELTSNSATIPTRVSKPVAISKVPIARVSALSTTKANTPRKKSVGSKGRCTIENPNIEKITSLSYSLPKSVVKFYSTHWKEANTLAHLNWATNKDGVVEGVRIGFISCNSPLQFSGLQRGDIVTAINGFPVQNEADLLKVYTKLLFWKKMNVSIRRKTQPMTIQYLIS